MQVLEMEELDTLVSNANRKRLNTTGASSRKKKGGILETLVGLANRGDMLSKVVVVACLMLLFLLYKSAQDETPPASSITKPKAPDHSSNIQVPEGQKSTNVPTGFPTQPVTEKKEASENAPEEKEEEEEVNHENDAFIYSRYATILPLVDHPLPSEEVKAEVAEKFGKWHFWDGDEDMRPMEDYTAKYPNRDIPGEDFPENAWQADAVYVNHILNDADQLIQRTMEAIFVEYGHGKPLPAEGLAERMKMFHWSKEDLSVENAQAPEKYRKRGDRGNGGWTTKRSFQGLVRRLLHAIMTQDTFTVVMGGHSAAAGQGNHFRQSYMMQFHKVMYPIFARLGVKLITRNVGMGGLGTMQAGMGSGSIYGDEIDILMWDSGMTEPEQEFADVFYRQALLAGKRIPILWGGPFDVLKMLHEEADVDVGDWGQAMDGIPEVESVEQAKTIPWAARYMKCKDGAQELCQQEPRFCAKCWVDREDDLVPVAKQLEHPKGQVKWHPGWRRHQLTGRNVAFAVLEGLQAAVNIWTEGVMGGPPLEDEYWHVTDYYENIRNKLKNLDKTKGACSKIVERGLPERLCNTPMKARTQYTPRANYHESALTSIIKPTADGYVPENKQKMLYEGPDAHNTCFDVPEGEVNVFNVVTGRRHLIEEDFSSVSLPNTSTGDDQMNVDKTRRLGDAITPGRGWKVRDEPPGLCDGTYNATCGRDKNSQCFLYGHHDARGAVIGDESAGWLVMNLEDLKEGLIILKLHTWYTPQEYKEAEPVDARRLGQSLHSSEDERRLARSYDTPELPNDFAFEYAVDGKITRLTKDEFLKEKKQIQRVVETLTILDDPNFTSESKDVEIAIRLVGSGKDIVFGVSHVYWA